MKKVDVLVVGAGMYVCGRGTDGYGTILPALFEACYQGYIDTIHIASTSKKSVHAVQKKAEELARVLGVTPKICFYPENKSHDDNAYVKAMDSARKPCCAIVSVPDQVHYPVTKQLIQNNLHLLVVKPLVDRVIHLKELLSLQQKHCVLGLVEFHKRFDEANITLRDIYQEGALGELLNIRVDYSQRKVVPERHFRNWVNATDIFQYLGIHYVDLIRFITGAVPLRVMSYGQKKWLVKKGIDNYDTILTDIEWALPEKGGNFLSSHLTGWIDPDRSGAMSDQRIEVIGTKGRFQSNQKERGITMITDATPGEEKINPYFSRISTSVRENRKKVKGYGPKSILSFIRDVSDIINRKKTVADITGLRATFETSLYPTAVIEASKQSLKTNNIWIKLDKFT
jgi:D-galacturonate reductase